MKKLPDVIKVRVLKRHIKEANPVSPISWCIALALRDKGYTGVAWGFTKFEILDEQNVYNVYHLDGAASNKTIEHYRLRVPKSFYATLTRKGC